MRSLTGPRGVGKSWLALAMAHAAARGGTLAGWRARRAQRVVYVDAASGEAILHARLAALAPSRPPPSLVLVPGDAQIDGLPDVSNAGGRVALDQLVTDADLVVLDGIAALVQAGRGVGVRWAALAGWLRSLRRRGIAVLLVEESEPRAIAALADTVLRLERPADPAAEPGLRFTVRVAAARALAENSCRAFELHMALRDGGAVWARRDDFDRRALAAWRLHRRDHSTREIARTLGVSPATAWRLVRHGKAMPAHLRDRAELPELEEERRQEAGAQTRRSAAPGGAAGGCWSTPPCKRRSGCGRKRLNRGADRPSSPAFPRKREKEPEPQRARRSPRRLTSEPSPACGPSTRGPHPSLSKDGGRVLRVREGGVRGVPPPRSRRKRAPKPQTPLKQ